MLEENKLAKLKQNKVLVITICIITAIFAVFIFSGPTKPKNQELSDIINDSKNKIILSDPNEGLQAEDRWLENAEQKLSDYDNFQKDYNEDKSGFESRISEVEKKYNETLEAQADLLELQTSEIESLKNQFSVKQEANKQDYFTNSTTSQTQQVQVRSIQSVDLNLENLKQDNGEFFKAQDYVPAGAYASAVIISGVDASVGLSAQSDPRPVLLRVQSHAKSSIYDGNLQKADINGCILTGAASGDLSSEKVYIKLIKMTCGKENDLLQEISIKGYVAGQGKSGVRGNVISREGDLLTKSFLAGLIGGFGEGLSQKVAPPLNFSNGLTTQGTLSTEDVARKGLGQGISSSSDRLANYLINRAEQYQPVVSIPSGIEVEVVFVEGFQINGKPKQELSKENKVNY